VGSSTRVSARLQPSLSAAAYTNGLNAEVEAAHHRENLSRCRIEGDEGGFGQRFLLQRQAHRSVFADPANANPHDVPGVEQRVRIVFAGPGDFLRSERADVIPHANPRPCRLDGDDDGVVDLVRPDPTLPAR
jgi:hypothetical protein